MLPCPECGEEQPVTTAHAGSSRKCSSCEKQFQVPKLGELRKLATQEDDEVYTQIDKTSSWDFRKGLVFGIGLIELVVFTGAAIGTFVFAEYNYETDGKIDELLEERLGQIDQMEPWMVYQEFNYRIAPAVPEEWQESPFLKNARTKNKFRMVSYVLLALGLLGGAATMFAATRLKPQNK